MAAKLPNPYHLYTVWSQQRLQCLIKSFQGSLVLGMKSTGKLCWIWSNFKTSPNKLEVKFLSWSDWMMRGISNTEMKAFKTNLAVRKCNRYGAGYLVTWHITVTKYSFSAFDLRKRPYRINQKMFKWLVNCRNRIQRGRFDWLIWISS